MLSSTLLHVHVYVHVVAFTTEASRRRSAIHSNLVIPYNLQYTSVTRNRGFSCYRPQDDQLQHRHRERHGLPVVSCL